MTDPASSRWRRLLGPFADPPLRHPPLLTVEPSQVPGLLAAGALLLDVREEDEFRSARIAGAVHIPLGALPARMRTLPKDRMVLTICHVGARSAQAAALLAVQGHDVRNVAGGMAAWSRAGLPMDTGDPLGP